METGTDLTLTIPRNKLGEFIGSLLGQQRKIERRFEGGHFIASHDWILNIVNIIEQRLEQNCHNLASFRCQYFFENGRIDTVETVDAFRAYHNQSSNTSVGVDIFLTYIVEFPMSSTPEKQVIRIEVFSDFGLKETASSTTQRNKQAKIKYMVGFTNLTFGEDISRHISAYIETIYKRGWVTKALEHGHLWIYPVIIAAMLLGVGIVYLLGLFQHTDDLERQFKRIEQFSSPQFLSEKLNLLIKRLILREEFSLPLLIVFGSVLAVGPAIILSLITLRRFNASHVIFNEYTEKKVDPFCESTSTSNGA